MALKLLINLIIVIIINSSLLKCLLISILYNKNKKLNQYFKEYQENTFSKLPSPYAYKKKKHEDSITSGLSTESVVVTATCWVPV